MTAHIVAGRGTLQRLGRRLPKSGRISVAVAYATREDHLPLNQGDRVVLNASDANVAAGSVDPTLVARWLRRGVDVYSHDSLHAKVIVRRGWAAIGSANWSSRADSILQEATWVGNDPAIVASAEGFIDGLILEGLELDSDWARSRAPMFRTASRPPPNPTERRPHSIVPVALRRMHVTRGEVARNPKYVNEAIHAADAAKPAARFRHYAVNLAGFQAPASPGDLLIWTSSDGFLDSPVLLDEYIKFRGSESSWCLATYDTSLDKYSVSVDALPRSVGTALKRGPVATITSRPQMRRLLAQWNLEL